MRIPGARALLAAAACCGVALAGGPPAGAASGVLLRYQFTVGQQTPYEMVLNLSGSIPGIAPKVSLAEQVPFTQTVKKVYPDGSALVVDTFTTATVTMNGQTTTTVLTGAGVTARITTQGQVISSKVTGLQGLGGGVLSIDPTTGIPMLPFSPVTVGSHWTAIQRISLGSFGALSGALHYKVLALDPVNGHTVATIQSKGILPLHVAQGLSQASGTATGTDDARFDATAGVLVSSHATIKVRATFGGGDAGAGQNAPITLTLHLNIDRVH
jgi:hypothetical protein